MTTYRSRGWLTPVEQGWVSACLLARVNQAGRTVQIDMRGDRPELGLDAPTAGFNTAEEIDVLVASLRRILKFFGA